MIDSLLIKRLILLLTLSLPDYVFASDYELLPLDKLKQYVIAEKHLPKVPPAEELAEQGMEMGKMQTLLLEKVEELTLYVIDLNEKNDKLQEANAALIKRITTLEEEVAK